VGERGHIEVEDGGGHDFRIAQLSRVDGINHGSCVLELNAAAHPVPEAGQHTSTIMEAVRKRPNIPEREHTILGYAQLGGCQVIRGETFDTYRLNGSLKYPYIPSSHLVITAFQFHIIDIFLDPSPPPLPPRQHFHC